MKKERSRVHFDRKTGRLRVEAGSGDFGIDRAQGRPPFEGRWDAGSQQSLEEFIRKWEQRFLRP